MKIKITVTRGEGVVVAEDDLEATPKAGKGVGTIESIEKVIDVGLPGNLEEVAVRIDFDPPLEFRE